MKNTTRTNEYKYLKGNHGTGIEIIHLLLFKLFNYSQNPCQMTSMPMKAVKHL